MAVADKATGNTGVGKVFPAPVYYISRVKTKLATGEYATEDVPCFCGSDAKDAIVVRHRDRFGIPHQMNLCKKCGLIWASPRMTQEAYTKFYNNEYRPIYAGWDRTTSNANGEPDQEKQFVSTLSKGGSFYNFIQHFDVPTDVVFEVGCNMGTWLMPFAEKGSEVYGVDLDHTAIEYGRTHGAGINIMQGGVERLVELDKKADLVILNQVFEHLLDLPGELEKIKKLLKPKGLLFIATPGVYTTNLHLMFQNAHTYQFGTDTLMSVLRGCGFEDYYVDEQINSLWKMADDNWKIAYEASVIGGLVDYQSIIRDEHDLFFGDPKKRRVPTIKTINKFTHGERKKNIQDMLSYGFPDINVLIGTEKGRESIVISGGPSIDDYIDKIKELQDAGCVVICIERMYPWCMENGIKPDYVVVLDASEDVSEALENPQKDVKHLLSTQCRTITANMLKECPCYVFSIPQHGVEQHNYWLSGKYDRATIINGGGSVALQAMAVSMLLGMRTLHIFGMDCHLGGGHYADGITGVGAIGTMVEVVIDDEVVQTTVSYLSFAQQFFQMWEVAEDCKMLDKIAFYGDSIIKKLAKGDQFEE